FRSRAVPPSSYHVVCFFFPLCLERCSFPISLRSPPAFADVGDPISAEACALVRVLDKSRTLNGWTDHRGQVREKSGAYIYQYPRAK
ncbi:uncharacterized protein BDW43DRAFT_264705, partial [Aspergillus alliaceus]|uniref:uncharacterized protein n=1 Tax=Petromyces alliaceus TaxID=209559 RepID=UPI0012A4DC57